MSLSFDELRKANTDRADGTLEQGTGLHSMKIDDWSILEWAGAMCGEAGEFANIAKKLRRAQFSGELSRDDYVQKLKDLADEAADVIIYLDLACHHQNIDLGEAVRDKFNRVSEKFGCRTKL